MIQASGFMPRVQDCLSVVGTLSLKVLLLIYVVTVFDSTDVVNTKYTIKMRTNFKINLLSFVAS
jgi:hypothetical protein